jgi:phospholipase/carboxylesterase
MGTRRRTAAQPDEGAEGLDLKRDSGFAHRFESGTNPAAPALLLLHGAAGDENTLLPLGKAIAPGAPLLSPRGRVLEHGMSSFVRRLEKGAIDLEDLEFRTSELKRFVVAVSETYSLTSERLVTVGVSNGAILAAGLLLRNPETSAGAILIRGMAPFMPEPMPDLRRKPILLLGGLDDPIVQTDEAGDLANILRLANAEVTVHWENAGHTLAQGDVLMAFDWLRRFYASQRTTGSGLL